MRKGYTDPFNIVKHNIPFLGEITTRHFRKSDQLQFKSTMQGEQLNLLTTPDTTSFGTMALICAVACLGAAFTVLRFHSHKGQEPQQVYEALIYN